MNYQRGSALVVSLMLLTILMILGTALLNSVVLDIAIGQNYRSETQLLYLAEVGIEEARTALRDSSTPASLLLAAAGADGVLSASRDLETLLGGTDDIPFINGGSRTVGKNIAGATDSSGGRYFVFLRNDAADGMARLTDSNQVLTLLSVAVLGNSRKVLEVTVMKWRFPEMPASLVVLGSQATLSPSTSSSGVSGIDTSTAGNDRHAIGVLTTTDQSAMLASIPDPYEVHFPGRGNPSPPPADVAVIQSLLDPRLRTPSGLERIVDRIAGSATELENPGWGSSAAIGSVGSPFDFRVVVVNGDCELGFGTGFGILLVRGNLRLTGNFHWNGLILVIGQGSIVAAGAGNGIISGAVLVARTREDDRSGTNELGTLLPVPGPVLVDFNGAGYGVQVDNPGDSIQNQVNQKFPYIPIAIREY